MSDAMLKYLENDLKLIQKFMDDNITAESPMTAGNIYKGVCKDLSQDIAEGTFRASLSTNINAGKITGFIGRRKIGYCKAGSDYKPPQKERVFREVGETEEEVVDKFTLEITKTFRIQKLDKLNYATQKAKKSDSGELIWSNIGYYSCLGECLKGAVKFFIDSGLKDRAGVNTAREVMEVLKQVEATMLGALIQASGDHPLERERKQANETEVETEVESESEDDSDVEAVA